MKILLAATKDGKAEAARWPVGFQKFIAKHSTNEGVVLGESALIDGCQLELPHGHCGAAVVISTADALPSAWKVAAHHSKDVCVLKFFDSHNPPRGDGLAVAGEDFTAPLAISTADCLAVAITLETSGRIELASCFHAGWRGYAAGIQLEVMNWMGQHADVVRARPLNWQKYLHVTIGPAIAGYNYPCGQDVESAVVAHLEGKLRSLPRWSSELESFYIEAFRNPNNPQNLQKDKIYPDLQSLMCIELYASGVELENISIVREDTFSSAWWPSHRRAMADGLNRAGRLVTHLCPPACPQVQNHVSKP
ncbi:MAG: laccase domain-containing protein [Silvanigrellaceae bacterium]